MSSVSVSSTTTNSSTKGECILHGRSDIERYDQSGICMVDKKKIELSSGRPIIQPPSQILMQTLLMEARPKQFDPKCIATNFVSWRKSLL